MSELNKPAMPQIDAFHYHEIADRCHVVQHMLEDHICDHPAMTIEQREKIAMAQTLICDVYQWAAQQALAASEPKKSLRDMTEADFDAVHGFDAAPDGWIEWHGGARPVPADTRVRVMLSYGEEDEDRADEFRWEHYESPGDIIAYRVVK